MPSIVKRKTSDVQESGFSVYAGDDPRPGGYRAILKFTKIGKSANDNLIFKPVLELKAAVGSEKVKYDGYPVFPNIVLTDNESNKQREQAFYLAIGASKDPSISCDVDPAKFKPGDGQVAKVLKIDKVKPEGIVVNVKLRYEIDNRPEMNGAQQLKCDMIFASRDGTGINTDEEDEEADIEDDVEDVEAYEEDDLLKMGLPALRKILVEEFGEPKEDAAKIKQKAKLVEAILEAQSEEEDDDDEEDESDDDEEDEEEDDDPEAEAREAAEAMNRTELKAAIAKRQKGFIAKKSQTDEDLVEILVPLLAADPPF